MRRYTWGLRFSDVSNPVKVQRVAVVSDVIEAANEISHNLGLASDSRSDAAGAVSWKSPNVRANWIEPEQRVMAAALHCEERSVYSNIGGPMLFHVLSPWMQSMRRTVNSSPYIFYRKQWTPPPPPATAIESSPYLNSFHRFILSLQDSEDLPRIPRSWSTSIRPTNQISSRRASSVLCNSLLLTINNYSPKWRWIAVDIYRAASARWISTAIHRHWGE